MVKGRNDIVEREYELAINMAAGRGDYDTAQDLANGLKEYRRFYKMFEIPLRED